MGQLNPWIEEHFPVLSGHALPGVELAPMRGVRSDGGRTTHPSVDGAAWVHSQGGERFLRDPDVPEGYFACGIQSTLSSEYLFAFWAREGRRFWFYGRTVNFICWDDTTTNPLAGALQDALDRWGRGESAVAIFAGDWPPVDPGEEEARRARETAEAADRRMVDEYLAGLSTGEREAFLAAAVERATTNPLAKKLYQVSLRIGGERVVSDHYQFMADAIRATKAAQSTGGA